MDKLVTRIPLKECVEKEQIISLIKEWLIGQKYGISSIDYTDEENKVIEFENGYSLKFINTNIGEKEVLAARFTNSENDAVWVVDCIYESDEDGKFFSVKLSCAKSKAPNKFPYIHKPKIVNLLLDKGYCEDKGVFPVVGTPIILTQAQLDICAEIMQGKTKLSLPVVYVSYDSCSGTYYDVDINNLAKELGGIAHVLVEPDKKFSNELTKKCNKLNACSGYVGIHFSGGKYRTNCSYKNFFKEGVLDKKEFQKDICSTLYRSLLNYQPLSDLTWERISIDYHKKGIWLSEELVKEAEREKEEDKALFEAEEKELNDKIKDLQEQIYKKDTYIETLKAALENKCEDGLISKGDFKEFYNDEVKDCIIAILEKELKNCIKGWRKEEIIKYLLENNETTGEGKKIFEEIEIAIKDGSTISRRRNLEKIGFVLEKGSHDKYAYKGNSKYALTISNSPQDNRSDKNTSSDFIRQIDIYNNK
ncbi:MAG: hypothetical protein ACI4QN_03945 [Candidatus Coproplasma sp.]